MIKLIFLNVNTKRALLCIIIDYKLHNHKVEMMFL